ncbi:hypothetical protein JTB14_022620 [Gonioctena quinquepunctata]|nr:hypothetical protein JTB14_022620 [Gonioctena quinquepunctata]
MAYSAMGNLCEKRRREKLPGLAIQWDLIGDVGMFMKSERSDEVVCGMAPQKIASCLEALESLMLQNVVIGSSMVLANKDSCKFGKSSNLLDIVGRINGIKNSGNDFD